MRSHSIDYVAWSAISALILGVAGWLTHIFWVINLLMKSDSIAVGKVVLALAGAFLPPFGALHGVWLWFN